MQLDRLRRQDFVYPDGRAALDQIERKLQKQRTALERLRPDTSADQVASTYANVRSLLGGTVPMLGFILRSTNVRNAFEAYDPLRRLCRQLFANDQVKLILSSDWDFSPVTLPMEHKKQKQFPGLIFIGLPATEGDNALLMPLAGHEIAHSLWQVLNVPRAIQKDALKYVREALKKRGLTDEQIDADIGEAQNLALRQCEEVFCDLFAVRLFGNAAMAAFGYFFVPGYEKRSRIYPKLGARFDYIARAYRVYFRSTPSITLDDIRPANLPDGSEPDSPILAAADFATSKLISALIERVGRIATKAGIRPPNPRNVSTIIACFENGCPADGDFALPEIMEAAWVFYEKRVSPRKWPLSPPLIDRNVVDRISDCVFKTMEVVEYRLRTGRVGGGAEGARKTLARKHMTGDMNAKRSRNTAPNKAGALA